MNKRIRKLIEKHESECTLDKNTAWEYKFLCIYAKDYNKLIKDFNTLINSAVEEQKEKDRNNPMKLFFGNRIKMTNKEKETFLESIDIVKIREQK